MLRQQYLDFAVGRNFRKSLLVHQDRSEQILASPDLERLADLRWAAHFVEAPANERAPKGMTAYRNQKNMPLYTRECRRYPGRGSAVLRMASQPRFDALLAATRAGRADLADEDAARKAVLEALQTLFRLNVLRYGYEPSAYDSHQPADTPSHPKLIPSTAYLQQ